MTEKEASARENILKRVSAALHPDSTPPIEPVPPSARVGARTPASAEVELGQLLAEIAKLGGHVQQLSRGAPLESVLKELVQAGAVHKATLWNTPGLAELGIAETLRTCGVEIIPASDSYQEMAGCDLGITQADAALPETGTLVLGSSASKPRAVSLLPRIHLAIIRPDILVTDLHQVFERMQGQGYFVFVTGPSRTSDIELTLTIGVHGPKELYVWVLP